jgi:carbonic anhydrase
MKQFVFLLLFLIPFTLTLTETSSVQAETILSMFNSLLSPDNYQPPNPSPEIQSNTELNRLENSFTSSKLNKIAPPPGKKSNKPKKSKKNIKKKKGRRLRKRKTYKNPVNVLKEGWLKISSPMFKHTGKFPLILLPNGDEAEIRCNRNYFRINEAFNRLNTSKNFPPSKLYFWFRLSGKNLYYSQSKKEINILGVLTIRNIVNTEKDMNIKKQKNCFRIRDREQRKWTLCAESKKHKYEWICQLKTILGYDKIRECIRLKKRKAIKKAKGKGQQIIEEEEEQPIVKGPTVITRKVTTPVILIPLPSKKCNESWDYANKGANWNCECIDGKEQSPINLPPTDKAIDSPIKPIFTFNEVKTKTKKRTLTGQFKSKKILTMRYKNNALRISHKYFGKVVTLDGGLYTAEEIVFHTPSEHQINGRTYDMEMQVVYYGKSQGDIAKQVLLCFLFKKKAGVYNKFIDDLDFFNLPNPNTKMKAILNPLFIPKIFYNANKSCQPVLKPFSFYTYQGSLTAPPCSERTIVYVAAKPIKLGSLAIQMFQEAIRVPDKMTSSGEIISSNIPNENNRSVQELNGRAIFYYDHLKYCGNPRKIEKQFGYKLGSRGSSINRKRRVKGHYEKVLKKMTEYFYVNGPIPSGLPGAYVVSPKEAIGNGVTTLN